MVNDSLFDFYKTMSWLKDHGYTIQEIESLSPMEFGIYIQLLLHKLEKKRNETQ